MAGWLHGVFVGDWHFVFPLCGFSLSLFCNYIRVVVGYEGPEVDKRLSLLCDRGAVQFFALASLAIRGCLGSRFSLWPNS